MTVGRAAFFLLLAACGARETRPAPGPAPAPAPVTRPASGRVQIVQPDPASPVKLALPRMSDAERAEHLPALRAQLASMFPRITREELDDLMRRAAEVSVEGGTLIVDVPAELPPPPPSSPGPGKPIPID
ncbi:MAG TPA: hypothetical protein VMZ28_20280 [Kofleriaceae bacterium]|nr:hypothetical protein [Kofleriaceae bacterium]